MSFNSLFGLGSHSPDANLEGWWPCLDNAANTTVLDYSGKGCNGTLNGGKNTSAATATGPNSWLTSSLNFDGSADYVTVASLPSSSDVVSVAAWCDPDTAGGGNLGRILERTYALLMNGNATTVQWFCRIGQNVTIGTGWGMVGGTYNRSASGVHKSYLNGAVDDSGSSFGAIGDSGTLYIGDTSGGTRKFDGKIANVSLFHRQLTDSEFSEIDDGAEPINIVAPVVSGTETEGQTLSCTTGTWGLDTPFSGGSNGTVTYSYQWTRSDDGSGTGEANIGGATSSTYTLQAADVSKHIRCYVAATNDGGRDVAADTPSNFTGAIAGAATDYTLTADHAAYEITGQPAGLRRGYRLNAEHAACALTGQSVGLRTARRVSADAGSLGLDAQTAALRAARRLGGDHATLSLTGQPANVLAARRLNAQQGSVSITGQDAALVGPGTSQRSIFRASNFRARNFSKN